MTEHCGKIFAAVQRRLCGSMTLTGIQDKEPAQEQVRAELQNMRNSVDEIKQDLLPKINKIARSAAIVDDLGRKVKKSLSQELKRKKVKLPKSPDALHKEKERKEKVLDAAEGTVSTLCSTYLRKIALEFGQEMTESERRSFEAAMEIRKQLTDELLASIQKNCSCQAA